MQKRDNTNIFRKKERLFPDGLYFISPKANQSRSMCIFKQKRNDGASLINGRPSLNAHQCFIIKFNKRTGFYTIMALHSHKYLGVKKNEINFCYSLIGQYPLTDNYLLQWDINSVNDTFYTFELIGTDLYLEYVKQSNLLQLNQKSYENNMLFIIKTAPTIKNGLYEINGKYDSNQKLYFSEKSTDGNALISNSVNKKSSIFWINFDEYDGCYSLTNMISALSLSTKSKYDNFLYQIKYKNMDYQKFIISSFDINKGDFFLELKSNLLRVEITDDNTQIKLSPYKPNFNESKKQLFHIKHVQIPPKLQKTYNDCAEMF